MSYDFDTLYQQWVDTLKTNIPSIQDDQLTVEEFILNVQGDVQDCLENGDPVDPAYDWVLDNQPLR